MRSRRWVNRCQPATVEIPTDHPDGRASGIKTSAGVRSVDNGNALKSDAR
jgi:hypothetical protein